MVISLNLDFFLNSCQKNLYRILTQAINWPGKYINIIFCKRFMSDHALWHGVPPCMKTVSIKEPVLKLWKKSWISGTVLYWFYFPFTTFSLLVPSQDMQLQIIIKGVCFTICAIGWDWNSSSLVQRTLDYPVHLLII